MTHTPPPPAGNLANTLEELRAALAADAAGKGFAAKIAAMLLSFLDTLAALLAEFRAGRLAPPAAGEPQRACATPIVAEQGEDVISHARAHTPTRDAKGARAARAAAPAEANAQTRISPPSVRPPATAPRPRATGARSFPARGKTQTWRRHGLSTFTRCRAPPCLAGHLQKNEVLASLLCRAQFVTIS